MKPIASISVFLILGSGVVWAQNDLTLVQDEMPAFEYLQEFHKAHSFIDDMNAKQRNNQLMQALQFYNAQRNREVSKFWIGVQCVEADSTKVNADVPIQGQLRYDGGLLVNSVTDDSPADAANIKAGDVIVSFNNEQTNEVTALVASIAAAGESQCPVQVLRDGDFIELKVTPARRNQDEDKDKNQAQQDFTRMLADSRVAQATAWLAGGKLPQDVKLTITIENGDEVKLRVERGGMVWEVEDDNLSELPDDIRPHVGSIMNSIKTNSIYSRYPFTSRSHPLIQSRLYQQPGTAISPLYRYYNDVVGQVAEKSGKSDSDKDRIDELSAKIDELTKIVIELKKDEDEK